MEKKYKIAKIINTTVCLAIAITIMLYAYSEWSKYGTYGVYQFLCSLVFHGGLGIMIYCGVDWILRRVFHQIK